MQGYKNESVSSHHSVLQCELQIVHYLLLGTGEINCVTLARVQVSKIEYSNLKSSKIGIKYILNRF